MTATGAVRSIYTQLEAVISALANTGVSSGWTPGEDGCLLCWRSPNVAATKKSWISSTLVSRVDKRTRSRLRFVVASTNQPLWSKFLKLQNYLSRPCNKMAVEKKKKKKKRHAFGCPKKTEHEAAAPLFPLAASACMLCFVHGRRALQPIKAILGIAF